jgi:hypothetical protein
MPMPKATGEDPAITRARTTFIECEGKLVKHLDGLDAGIPADVIASRIAATQREKSTAEVAFAATPPAPRPLKFDEVLETLTALRDLHKLLGHIEQSDRAALHPALGLTVRYRRNGSTEEVKLTSTLRSVTSMSNSKRFRLKCPSGCPMRTAMVTSSSSIHTTGGRWAFLFSFMSVMT